MTLRYRPPSCTGNSRSGTRFQGDCCNAEQDWRTCREDWRSRGWRGFVRLLSRVRTGLQRPLANKQPLFQGKATLIWRMTHIGRQSRPCSPVELERFLLSSVAGDVYTGATVGGVSRCVESWLCGNFITCMVHGSVDLPSAFVYRQMWECWWVWCTWNRPWLSWRGFW